MTKSLQYRPTMLMILDGWGFSDQDDYNAVKAARTPNLDKLIATYPHTLIASSGLAVGLPDGQMGNSEVGHLNIGAGRTVYQALTRIDKDIADGSFYENEVLLRAYDNAKDKALHLMGLVSDGGVHSHINHLLALLEMAKRQGLSRVFIHAILDGRDTPPRSADIFLAELQTKIDELGVGEIATICGRYYAMDRDNRFDRVEKAYDALVFGEGLRAEDAQTAIAAAYARGEDDEFVLPTLISENSEINRADSVIFFNFRPDRAREITRAVVDSDFDGFVRDKIATDLVFVCMTEYDKTMPNVLVAYPPEPMSNTLGQYISGLGYRQLRIAETEKYAHVTFFFNGGVEKPNAGEDRILIPSPKVATYDLQPEMSSFEVADAAIEQIVARVYDLIILNFANMDMVGHTGIMAAAVKAVEAVDTNVGRIVEAVLGAGGQLLITADHGNAEKMLDSSGKAMTAHSTNPVRLVYVRGDEISGIGLRGDGALSDIAPTLLDVMGLDKPNEMTGTSLIVKLN